MASRSVTNITITPQTGVENSFYSTWEFKAASVPSSPSGSSSSIRAGALVSIKSGATYYNGAHIPSFVMADRWYISYLKGDRAVLGKNPSGTYNIQSPINTKYLTPVTKSVSTLSDSTTDSTLDHFEVKWEYLSKDSVWFSDGGWSSTEDKNSIYSPPDNAVQIKINVKPVSKTHKPDGKTEVSYWDGVNNSASYNLSYAPPDPITSVPTVEPDAAKYKLKVSISGIEDPRADMIEFQMVKINPDGSGSTTTSQKPTVYLQKASCEFTMSPGCTYKVRARSINIDNPKSPGEWSPYSEEFTTIPDAPTDLRVASDSETSVKATWTAAATAESYEVQYIDKKIYFDTTSGVSSVTVTGTTAYITGLESGQEWFFRVRAVNDEGESSWSAIQSVKIGTKPSAPTTWSSTTTAITGEPLTLYWVHNSEDGSSQTYAELELYIDGEKQLIPPIKNTEVEEDKDKTSSYPIDTSQFTEGTKIQWAVRTAGITLQYGDWSVQRTVDIYAPPTLDLEITDANGSDISTLLSFPFYVKGLAGPSTQLPIGYYVSISSDSTYETLDHMGNPMMINAGDLVYSQNFDTDDVLLLELTASSLDLQNGIDYTVNCLVTMNSGLTVEASLPLTVSWNDVEYYPNAEIGIDENTYSAYIRPYCIDDSEALIPNVMLSVYRRDFDGNFIEISKDIDNLDNTFVTDPHPALDFARYRIVAIDANTGAISYHDIPGYPVGGKAVVIQWEEEWSNFYTGDNTSEDEMSSTPWSGSILKLPYNIDVSDGNSIDVELVEYIGRKYPVSYYGTHMGESSTWNVTIAKEDTDTIYALRRLARWTGDAYVREPSGTGYWAHVSVSFSQKHTELTIPVTLNLTRVEGGI